MNRALRVGRVPPIVVDVLNVLDTAGLAEHFSVVGTYSLHAYESACGVRFVPAAMATRDIDGDPHPLRLSDDEDDVWAVQASTGDRILSSPRFSQMVVATNGDMALMHTMHPPDFVKIKRALADYPTREPLKRTKDRLQADLVEDLVRTHMPQYAPPDA